MSFQSFPFSVSFDKFLYLGVSVSRRYKDLFNSNFKTALDKAKRDMVRWSTLPLSLAGKINSIKMTILPRFLFLFQTVPVFIPKSFFKDLNSCISMFLWDKKFLA